MFAAIRARRLICASCFFKYNFRQLKELTAGQCCGVGGIFPPSFYAEKALTYNLLILSLTSNESDRLACAITRARGTCGVKCLYYTPIVFDVLLH